MTTVVSDRSVPLPKHIEILETADDIARVRPLIAKLPIVGYDTETTGLDPHFDTLRLIQFGTPETVYVVDLLNTNPRLLDGMFTSGPIWVAHYAQFDLRFTWTVNLLINKMFCTMLASQVLWAGTLNKGHSLSDLTERHLGMTLNKKERRGGFHGELTQSQLEYAARDVVPLVPLHDALWKELGDADLHRTASLEMRAMPAYAWMAQAGVKLDRERWIQLAEEAAIKRDSIISELDKSVLDVFGKRTLFGPEVDVNWGSPDQLGDVLFDLGIELPNTLEETLVTKRALYPIIDNILLFREFNKKAQLHDYTKHIHHRTERIHASWNQLGAAKTGRSSCSNPNLQNVDHSKEYRSCFIADDGYLLYKADYSQIELRIMAQMSRDPVMLKAYKNDEDLHRLMAMKLREIHHADMSAEMEKKERDFGKTLNFGFLYGMGADSFQSQVLTEQKLAISDQEALDARNAYFELYKGVQRLHRSTPQGGINTRTLCGRRSLGVWKFTEKINYPVQGTSADATKVSMALFWEHRDELPGAFPILVVHDEIVMQSPNNLQEETTEFMTKYMTQAMKYFLTAVPVKVEVRAGKTWAG